MKFSFVHLSDNKDLRSLLGRLGFVFLSATLFLISFPRSWALYPLCLFLISGLIYWIADFKNVANAFKRNWYLVLPPVFYFLVHFFSVVIQWADLRILEDRLMFLLIPVFGFPLFRHEYFRSGVKLLLQIFLAGISLVSVFLISRILIVTIDDLNNYQTLSDFFSANRENLFSLKFSVIEHPTYLSMKIIFCMVMMLFLPDNLKMGGALSRFLFLLFTLMIFFLASKSGIVIWIVICLIYVVRWKIKRIVKYLILLLMIPSMLIAIYFVGKHIGRIDYFFATTRIGLIENRVEWKDIDQRTREWYTSIQLIKEKPVTGIGLAKIDRRMAEEYMKNGYKEEADLHLNAHNQFLEAQMTFGIAGTISLLLMLLTPAFIRRRHEFGKLALVFVIMVSFFLLFESMFNRQWGIMFFLLFYFILIPFDKKITDYEQ